MIMAINAEMFVVIVVFIIAALLCTEYIWLYIISNRQEEILIRSGQYDSDIHTMLEAILSSPTLQAKSEEMDNLFEYIGNDYEKFDITVRKLLQLFKRYKDFPAEKQDALRLLYERLSPIQTYKAYFEQSNPYQKGYICRRFADFKAVDELELIRKCLNSKNKDLQYNAAMALSELSDEEYVLNFIKMCEDNRKYSHRVIIELLDLYTGDKASLVMKAFDTASDYMKATLIKGVADDKLEPLEHIYLEGMKSTNTEIKIACVKALSKMAQPRHEHELIIALNDKNWVVRASAIHGLQKINTSAAIAVVEHATGDEEWWVRQIAARALTKMDFDMSHVEAVLSGYDKYASDAVRSSLYRMVDMRGGGQK